MPFRFLLSAVVMVKQQQTQFAKAVVEVKNVYKTYDDETALGGVSFDVREGEFLTLLGPSGCGKTTLLRLISGFEQPDEGQVIISDQDMRHVPPNKRRVNTIFQRYALFPHMTVFQNVAFGLRCQRRPQSEIETRVQDALALVKLSHLRDRNVTTLSGGQQQRVSIARAVVNRPAVLLLDEPLSALDYRLRVNMQLELKQLQRRLGIAFIFVTHDQEEALSLSDRIVVMDHGKVEQIGTPRDVYENPINLRVAQFIGEMNVFSGVVHALTASREMTVDVSLGLLTCTNNQDFKLGDRVHIVVRPEDIQVYLSSQLAEYEITPRLEGRIIEVIYKGSTVDLIILLPEGKRVAVTRFFNEDDDTLAYRIGDSVYLDWITGWEVVLVADESERVDEAELG